MYPFLDSNASIHHTESNMISAYELTVNEKVALLIVLSLIVVISLYGNCGMLHVLNTNQKMWSCTYMLIGNLAAAGVMVTLVSMPFSLASVIMLRWPFENDIICQLSAFMSSMLLNVTMFTHTVISVSKYFGVVMPYSRTMTIPRTKRILFAIWFLAALISIGPFVDFGRYAFGPTTLACGVAFPANKTEIIYLLILACVSFIGPVLIMIHVYVKIFVSMRRRTKRLMATSSSTTNPYKLQRKLLTTTLCSLLCYLLCWTPFCIFIMTSFAVVSRDKIPRGLGIAAYWGAFSYNAINPIIFIAMCPRFREGLFSCHGCHYGLAHGCQQNLLSD